MLEVGVVGFFLMCGAFMAWAIGSTWQPTHTNQLLMVFGIAVTLAATVFAAVAGVIVGMWLTKNRRAQAASPNAPQVIAGQGYRLPDPPATLSLSADTSASEGGWISNRQYTIPLDVSGETG